MRELEWMGENGAKAPDGYKVYVIELFEIYVGTPDGKAMYVGQAKSFDDGIETGLANAWSLHSGKAIRGGQKC